MVKGGRGDLGRAAVFCWLILGFFAAAGDGALSKKVKEEEKAIQVFNAVWENPTGMVEKKLETPGGAVYRFSSSVPYSAMYPAWDELRAGGAPFHSSRSCKCTTCEDRRQHYALEASIPPAKKRNMRFVAVEFFIRKFPALQPDSKSDFEFTLAFSSYPKIDGDFARVTGILKRPDSIMYYFDEACRGVADSERQLGLILNPQFGWNYYRIVFDTEARLITIFSNGCVEYTKPLLQIKGQSFDINGISIFEPDQVRGSQWLLEISNPIFYRFDHFTDLFELPKVDFKAYPYELYGPNVEKRNKKWQSSRNPDAQYAEAMRILRRQNDDSLPKAIDLLEKAAKDDHVFANYELGICYMYGVGVRRNPDKARQYFAKAVKRGYEDDVQATRALLLWSQASHEIFMDNAIFSAFQDCRNSSGQSSFPVYYLFAGFGTFSEESESGVGMRDWVSTRFSEDQKQINSSPDSIYYGRKITSNQTEVINRIPISAMTAEENTPVVTPGGWYISQLKRYMAEGHGAAFYRFGELWLWLTRLSPKAENECLVHALTAFKDGARQGDDFCYIESLIIQATQGTLKPEAFSLETDLRFHRNPRYYLVKYAAIHPNLPWWRDFQFRRHALVNPKMFPPDTPEQKYLRGLMLLAPYFSENEGYNKVMWRMMENFPAVSGGAATPPQTAWNEAIEGYRLLEEAAEAGIPEAQFLIGMLYLVTPEKTPTPVRWSNDRQKGVKFLSQLDSAKWPLASYYLAQYASQQSNLNRKIAEWEKLLKPACDVNFGPAWYLLGQLYERYNYPVKAEGAYLKAGDAGILLGYSTAACLMDDKKRDSRSLWLRFLKLHLEARRQNRLDPYDETVTFHCGKDHIPAGYYLPPADMTGLLP